MITALAVSLVLLWIAFLALAFVTYGLARQVGILHERIAPAGALVDATGLSIGDIAPALTGLDGGGRPLRAEFRPLEGRRVLLLFVAPDCPVCKKLIPIAADLARRERGVDLWLAGEGAPELHQRMLEALGVRAPLILADRAGALYRVGKLPHAVLIGAEGRVRAQGLVNTREHLESLLNADELGVASIQDYLASAETIPSGASPAGGRR
jgi:methylamine dehydrogenase accessory protein MauD